MRVGRLAMLGFRNLREGEVELGAGVTLLWGPNGAGKTNVLEAMCVALSGRSCRTRTDRETIAFDRALARVEVEVSDEENCRAFLWSVSRSGERRHLMDGSAITSEAASSRPTLSIFLPDRLALVKGPPANRRTHVDQLVAALRPARAGARSRYARALAQRNALLGRIRRNLAPEASLDAWDAELAQAGVDVIAARRTAIEGLASEFTSAAEELGLPGAATLAYRPRSEAADPGALASELRELREADLSRGYTGHGPHLDDLEVSLDGRSLRRYGSQGEQRVALLALLFAERRALLDARRVPPLMLLDDVMSELDPERRVLLARRLGEGGQAIVTATEPDQLPRGCERVELAVRKGEVIAQETAEGRQPPAGAQRTPDSAQPAKVPL